MKYKHTQVGSVILILVSVVILFLFYLSRRDHYWWVWLTSAFLTILLVLFGTLTVEINEEQIRCYFGPGVIHKEFKLDEVTDTRIVIYPWYYGWGIRLTPAGWMYNVSGLKAVELSLASGKKFWIGTDEPEQLADAIHSAIQVKNLLPQNSN